MLRLLRLESSVDNETARDIVELGDPPPERWSNLPLGELE
jgi:hypothetical protein